MILNDHVLSRENVQLYLNDDEFDDHQSHHYPRVVSQNSSCVYYQVDNDDHRGKEPQGHLWHLDQR